MAITLQDIIQNSDYALTIFSPEEIAAIELLLLRRDFWDKNFQPIPPDALFPPNDEVESICTRLREGDFGTV
jgi:hypothetical protein